MTNPRAQLAATNIRADLDRLAQKAREYQEKAPKADGSKNRWRILAEKLEGVRDLAVLKNLEGNGPPTMHHGRT